MVDLSLKSASDQAICENIDDLDALMQQRTLDWARINTGSWNREGLDTLAPMLAEAYSVLEADIELIEPAPIEHIGVHGETEVFETSPIITVTARPAAPVQIIMSGHYDTVFPPDTFTEIRSLDADRGLRI